MQTQIVKWGTSQGIRIPKTLLANIGIEVNEPVELTAQEGMLIIKPIEEKTIDWYLEDYERPEDTTWEEYNEPRGHEVW
jgi:antitoxin MazE